MRTRTERYSASFSDLGGVEGVLDRLAARPEPMVVRIERQPGQREERYAHLLAGPPDLSALAAGGPPPGEAKSRNERLDRLEEEVQQLRADFDALRERLSDLLDS
jgi:uncharacterized protein YceH (UPF0502 family)